MQALITGGTGFVGGHLIDQLLTRGASVTALVRSSTKAAPLAERGVTLVVGDLLDLAALDRAVAGQDVIFHVAGLIAARNEAEFLEVNRDGTRRLVGATREAGVRRLVMVSSLAAGGPARDGRPLDGTEAPRPVTQYGRSKLAGEQVVRESGLDWTIIRPPPVYGPGDREMLRVFQLATSAVAPVLGDGRQRLSLVFGPDLAAAIADAAATDRTVSGTFYPAHPEIQESRDLIRTIGRLAGRRPWIVGIPGPVGRLALRVMGTAARLAGRATVLTADKANELLEPAWLCDPTPLTRMTGWRAAHDFASGAALTLAWYRERGWLRG